MHFFIFIFNFTIDKKLLKIQRWIFRFCLSGYENLMHDDDPDGVTKATERI